MQTRVIGAMALLMVLFGCSQGPTPSVDQNGSLAMQATSNLKVSYSNDRSNPQALGGSTLRDNVYVFYDESGTTQVEFFLDEAVDSSPYHTENLVPFDLVGSLETGTTPYKALALDTATPNQW